MGSKFRVTIGSVSCVPRNISYKKPFSTTAPLEKLKQEHLSRLRNRKIAEMFFYAGWIEQWGSGTLKIVRECVKAGLPEPEFTETQGALWLTFRQDVLTEEYLRSLGLNERQIKGMLWVKEKGAITNRDYRELNGLSDKGARQA